MGAAVNGAFAVADLVPGAVVVRGLKLANKGIRVLKEGAVTADAARKVIRRRGVAGPEHQIHHSIPLNGLGRNTPDWRNHYAFLKVLPTEQHRRLTGSWNGKPRYDPIRRVWYGTTDWQKAATGVLAGHIGAASDASNNHD